VGDFTQRRPHLRLLGPVEQNAEGDAGPEKVLDHHQGQHDGGWGRTCPHPLMAGLRWGKGPVGRGRRRRGTENDTGGLRVDLYTPLRVEVRLNTRLFIAGEMPRLTTHPRRPSSGYDETPKYNVNHETPFIPHNKAE